MHPKAIISETARIGTDVVIGANSIIADEVVLQDGVQIGANVVIEKGVCIGHNTIIANNVAIHERSRIGAWAEIDSGVVIGTSPFNRIKTQGRWQKNIDRGGVIISDYVKIGANTTIARGEQANTCILEGVCIDNLVQIAHDVIIGEHSAIAGCAAIGAFAHIGSHCIIGGASCIAAQVTLADDVVITGMSTVSKSIQRAGIYSSGTMVSEHNQWRRNVARFRRLDDYALRLIQLEKELRQT